jgi:hypothetical protein
MTPVDNGDVAGCGELFGGGTDRWDHGAVLSVGFRLPWGDVASTNKTVEGIAVYQHTSLRLPQRRLLRPMSCPHLADR